MASDKSNRDFPFAAMLERLYGAITDARNSLYEKEFFKSFSLGVPTVSVGNITVGGTGKTPLVAFIAGILADDGEQVCVLTRGYGRENPKKRVLVSDGERIFVEPNAAGDEPFELAQKLLGKAIVVADADRVAAGNWARDKFRITAFVLDDAFQHRRVKRDIDIVTIDAMNPFGNEKLLPKGILRETLKNLKRADAIVITRANLTNKIQDLKARIAKCGANCPIFVTENKVLRVNDLEKFSVNPQSSEKEFKSEAKPLKSRALAFCALGNPNNFFEQLRHENFDIVSTEIFPDHYFYTQRDIAKLEKRAREAKAEILLTTAKDAVKLKNLSFNLPCLIVESEMIFAGNDDFRRWLLTNLRN